MDLEQKIRDVQSAIQHLEAIKSHLDKNTNEVKSNMNTTFLRHLRSLWNRQVFLFSQVDLIHSTKEEVLQRQLVRLHTLLTSLQSQLGHEDGTMLFDMNDLRPEESPYISFRADTASLKEAILNYGRVDHTGFPLTSQFMDPRSPAASLPPHFEDYDDAEHHILYKTVEEIKHAKTNSRNIDVHIPKLSARPEDWLTHSTATTTTASALQPAFAFPTFSKDPSDWLKSSATEVSGSGLQPIMSVISPDVLNASPSVSFCSASSVTSGTSIPRGIPTASSTTSSIDTWLLQIKQNPDMEEEDDFEIVDGSGATGVYDTEDIADQPSGTTPSVDIHRWTASPSVTWLKSESQSTGTPQVVGHDVIANYLAKRDNDLSVWLAPKQKTGCCGDSCCDKPAKSVEIENLGDYLADKLWIKCNKNSEKSGQVSGLCKANEPCQSFNDCLGTPSCLEEHQERVSGMDVTDLPGFSIFKHSNDNQTWLANGGKNVGPTTRCVGFEHFQRASREIKDWLLNEKDTCSQPKKAHAMTITEVLGNTDSRVWLHLDEANKLPPLSTPFQSCGTWDQLIKQHGEIGSDQWLLPPNVHSITDIGKVTQDVDQEIWLLHKESMETEIPSKEQAIEVPYIHENNAFWLHD
ncbi:nuclear receptor coactivator 4-like [Mizuhopecten yessoensis]|uniref:Nuclear receptor coactivator 4 n=1 Tax=Mizuhopecten yessoensis TaxID=6573 RepID=A0A210QPE0_MIZYE|nr:nuclear receptor coactivator 4-like [Mizuhopecten yessoensis]XP_021353210.1 nuclear receptor coactivator 4-like [Mizuhopecten yessoensis]OWF50602.1 Nuclear receptor coactivator 4 [Mizuhopecten yessoensis]